MMYKVVLEKLKSNHANLRTPVIEGFAGELPAVGKRFVMTAAPLNPLAAFRYVETTTVQTWVRELDAIWFSTEK